MDPRASDPAAAVLRAATLADVPAVTALAVAENVEEFGAPDFEADDVLHAWRAPGFDLARDAAVAVDAEGGVLGAAWLQIAGDLTGEVLAAPGLRGGGLPAELLGRIEARAAARGARALRLWSSAGAAWRLALLARAGYAVVRSFRRMELVLDGPPPPPAWPAGIVPALFDPGRDLPAAHAAFEEAFAGHFGFSPMPLEAWRREMAGVARFDPSLWLLARDGAEIAGLAIAYDQDDLGWVRVLAVRPAWRGRGLGRALLQACFGRFVARGRARVGLGVDADNAHGAVRLYEAAGMRATRTYLCHERAPRARA